MPSDFVPKRRLISDVTREERGIVTTSESHGYETGLTVRLFVPKAYGMEVDFVETQITVLNDTQFQTELDTTFLNAFVVPTAPPAFTQAQVVPVTGTTDNAAR